jgi:hypothetical protein
VRPESSAHSFTHCNDFVYLATYWGSLMLLFMHNYECVLIVQYRVYNIENVDRRVGFRSYSLCTIILTLLTGIKITEELVFFK